MANNFFLTEPTFYGRGELKGLTAEDFIERVEAFKANHTWNDAQTAAHAISYLRGPAQQWFLHALAVVNAEKQTAAKADYTTFRKVFINEFFEVKSTTDLGVDWHSLRQMDKETVRQFASRTFAVLHNYQRYLQEDRLDPRDEVMRPVRHAVAALYDDDTTQDAKDAIADAVLLMHRDSANRHIALVVADTGKKLLAAGVRSGKVRELILRETRKKTAVDDLIDLADQAEQASNKPGPVTNTKASSSVPNAAKVAAVEDKDDHEQDGVDAVNTKKGKNKGRGRGNGNRGGRGGGAGTMHGDSASLDKEKEDDGPPRQHRQQDSSTGNKPKPKYPCSWCHKSGYFISDCFEIQKIRKMMGTAAVGGADSFGPSDPTFARSGNDHGWM